LGVAIGVLIGFTPTMGAQTVMAIALAALLRGNKAACVPFVWVTNPLSFVPVYGFCWWVGSLFTGGSASGVTTALRRLQTDGQAFLSGFFTYDAWAGMFRLLVELGLELWIGCLVLGIVASVPSYFLTRWGVTAYRVRRHEHLVRSHERRLRRRQARAARVIAATDAA
jgi:hypothetical protein